MKYLGRALLQLGVKNCYLEAESTPTTEAEFDAAIWKSFDDLSEPVNGLQHFDISWSEVKALADSLEAAEPLKLLRKERNNMLTQTDWTQQGDVPEPTRLAWQDYRQALRDITNTYTSLNGVVWPEKPE